ncbi:MAG: FUSC family protein [Sphingomonas sp.]
MAAPLIQRTEIRQTAQVAVGAGLSIIAGSLISGQRWYWALIAAFIVGIGAGSRSESLVKGLQRVAGTVAGVLVGIGLATLVTGHTIVTIVLSLLCVFLAFYAFQAAYGTMIFFITLMLALLYSLLGMFKPELLVLRLEETAAGAAIGTLATIFVLPVRQRAAFAEQFTAFLDALRESIAAAPEARGSNRDDPIRRLQQAGQDLRNAVGALKRGWLRLVDRRYLLTIRAARRCGYLVREATYRGHLPEAAITAATARIDWLRQCAAGEGGRGERPSDRPDVDDDDLGAALVDAVDRLADRYEAIAGGKRRRP